MYRLDNYRSDVLRPRLEEIAKETGIDGIDFGIKEVQVHLRHSRATTTLDIYIQEIPKAVPRCRREFGFRDTQLKSRLRESQERSGELKCACLIFVHLLNNDERGGM